MNDFQWRMEDEQAEGAPAPPAPRRRFSPFLLLGILLLLGGIAAVSLYRLAHRQIDQASSLIEADVRASFGVIRQAAVAADGELFVRFLSGADPVWADVQKERVATASWRDQPSLGLYWTPTLTATAVITLSADMREAELFSLETYTRTLPGGDVTTFVLQQTSVYRHGPGRWLYAPPTEDFWGETAVVRLPRLTLSYPRRDEALATRLAADLDRSLVRLCATLADLDCAEDFRLDLAFATQELPGTALAWWARRPLTLPAPTLVGLPQDEAGYQALYDGYASHVAAAALADLTGWTCCQGGLFLQALFSHQLAALELVPPPQLPRALYDDLLQERINIDDIYALWNRPPAARQTPSRRQAQAAVDFLLARDDSPALLPRARQLVSAASYRDWLHAFVTEPTSLAVELAWYSYLYDHVHLEVEAPPRPLPAADLLLLCGASHSEQNLFRYDVREATFTPASPGHTFAVSLASTTLLPYPGTGVLVVDNPWPRSDRPGYLRLSLWQDGEERLLWDSGPQAEREYRFEGLSPLGTYLLLSKWRDSAQQYLVAAVDSCATGQCDWQQWPYRPVWSPDERYVVNALTQGQTLFLAEATSATQPYRYLDLGMQPFWLDEETFGYVRRDFAGAFTAVVSGRVDEDRVETLFTLENLTALLPRGASVAPGIRLLVSPDGSTIYGGVVATTGAATRPFLYVFAFDRASGRLMRLFQLLGGSLSSLELDLQGRYLLAGDGSTLFLYVLDSHMLRSYATGIAYPRLTWSPDGAWLFAGGRGTFLFLAPADDFALTRVADCASGAAVWLPESAP